MITVRECRANVSGCHYDLRIIPRCGGPTGFPLGCGPRPRDLSVSPERQCVPAIWPAKKAYKFAESQVGGCASDQNVQAIDICNRQ
jgi:hypothetical protein